MKFRINARIDRITLETNQRPLGRFGRTAGRLVPIDFWTPGLTTPMFLSEADFGKPMLRLLCPEMSLFPRVIVESLVNQWGFCETGPQRDSKLRRAGVN